MRERATWVVLAASVLYCRTAEAERDSVRLAWVRGQGAEMCLSEAELSDRVSARLGRNPFSERSPLAIEGWVVGEGTRLRATLRVRGEPAKSGSRELDSEELDCAALGDAVVLAVALAIDPEAALRPPQPDEPGEPAAAGPIAPSADPVREPARPTSGAPAPAPARAPPAETRRARGDWVVRLVGNAGILPRWAWGTALGGNVRFGERAAAMVALMYLPEARTDSGRAAFGATTGQLTGCFAPIAGGSGGLDACAGVELGALHAVSYGERPLAPGDRPWVAGLGVMRGWLRLEPVLLEAGMIGGVPVIRHEFVVRGEPDPVFSPKRANFSGFVGVGMPF